VVDGSVGAKLREARERRGLAIAEVEAATKIRPRYVQALENEEWEQLPGEVYARAFIRTYGSFLGLDGDELADEQRRESGGSRPGERLPRVDPRPRRVAPRRRAGRRIPPTAVAIAVSALVVAALLAVGLTSGSGGGGEVGGRTGKEKGAGGGEQAGQGTPAQSTSLGHSLKLVATREVWVCLENGQGKRLIPGRTLLTGATEGPFRSGRFSLALGNGGLQMIVDDKRVKVPDSSSPVGYLIDREGAVRELPEGERPTCT
jgi:transcriptional regulator with XRE-family HTH domain